VGDAGEAAPLGSQYLQGCLAGPTDQRVGLVLLDLHPEAAADFRDVGERLGLILAAGEPHPLGDLARVFHQRVA
jgi:hypothetical protein